MKKHTFYSAVCSFAGVFLAALLAVIGTIFLTPASAAVGVALAVTPGLGTGITGTSVVGDAAARQIPTVSQIIDEYDPELTPFTSFLNRIGGLNDGNRGGAGPAYAGDLSNPKSVEIEILERSRFQRFAIADGGESAGTAGNAVVVDVEPGHMIVPTDIVKVMGNATDGELDYYVTGSTATTITLKALPKVTSNVRGSSQTAVAYGTVPAIANGAVLTWVGSAKSEADAASRPRRMEPTNTLQYIQTLDQTAALSDHAMRIAVYGSAALESDATRQLAEEFKKTREAAYLFQGMKSVVSDTNLNGEVQKIWKMTGMRGFVTNEITLPDNPDIADISQFVYDAHAGFEGKVAKVLFAGTDVMSRFDSVLAAHANLTVDMKDEEVGVSVRRLTGSRGWVDLVWHPMFDEYDLADEGLLVDMRYIGRAVMHDVEERGGDNKQKEYGAMVDRELWQLISKEALVLHKGTGERAVHHRVVLG